MTPHPLPDAALETDIAILAKKGRGKTFTARGLVERLLDMGRQVVVLDPLQTWWGVKAGPNAYPVAVVGGPHGDIPLARLEDFAQIEKLQERQAVLARALTLQGEALGRHFATATDSVVIDVSDLTSGNLIRFATAFLEQMYTGNRKPIWLVLEEADVFAPQTPQPDATRLLHEVDRIARRGRAFGFRLISLTQRPARLAKDVLTQLSTLIALGITSPQDRGAVEDWIKGAGDPEKSKEVLATLARLDVGEGWIWAPDQDLLARVRFPKIKTLDTMSTPKAGETRAVAKVRKDVDVAALRTALLTSRETTDRSAPAPLTSNVTKPSAAEIAAAEQRGFVRGEAQGLRRGVDAGWKAAATLFERDVLMRANDFPATPDHENAEEYIAEALGLASYTKSEEAVCPAPIPQAAESHHQLPPSRQKTSRRVGASEKLTSAVEDPDAAALSEGERKLVAAIGSAKLSWPAIAVRAGYVASGGGFRVARKALLSRDILALEGDTVALRLPPKPQPVAPPTLLDLVDIWRGNLPSTSSNLLAIIVDRTQVTSVELASAAGLVASGGGFRSAVKKLRTAGLVEQRGDHLGLSAAFVEAAAP